jgi:hypothetical protein
LRVSLLWNSPDSEGGYDPRSIKARIEARISRNALARARKWRRYLAAHGEEDAGWNWSQFLRECSLAQDQGLGNYIPYSLWALGELQGLMIAEVSGRWHRTRESNQSQVYVEYLSVAPDNRPSLREPRNVIGCGSALLGAARRESARRGWQGRIGLHSLPGAIGFYKGQGFRDLGLDPHEEGCHYMELSDKVKG